MHTPTPPIDGPLLKAWFATVVLCLVSAVRRYLRITVAVISLVACMLLAALWVRSYWWCDQLTRVSTDDCLHCSSFRGQLICQRAHMAGLVEQTGPGWLKGDFLIETSPFRHAAGGFFRKFKLSAAEFIMPYWFPVIMTGLLAAVLGIRRPYRFSLRTLLIAMTVIVGWLGLIASLI